MEVYSRLNFNPAHFSRNLFTWIHLFIAQLPNLFITAIPYISYESLGLFSLLASLFWILRKNNGSNLNQLARTLNVFFLIISTGALLSSSLIFILTDESAVSWGYQARGLSSTWFALAIWVASIVNFSQVLPKILRIVCLLITLFLIFFLNFGSVIFLQSFGVELVFMFFVISLVSCSFLFLQLLWSSVKFFSSHKI
jgi:hypothetical protein